MGEVYKARDTRLDRTVAIKIFPADVAGDADVRARFEREARAIAALDHPHICAVYDVGQHTTSTGSEQAVDYLVMQYLEGETLSARLARTKGPLPLDQVLTIAMEIAGALDKTHRAGVTHRDSEARQHHADEDGRWPPGLATGEAARLRPGEATRPGGADLDVGDDAARDGGAGHGARHDSGHDALHGAGASGGPRGRRPQ